MAVAGGVLLVPSNVILPLITFLRIDEADVECAEADAADIDLVFQDQLLVTPHLVAIIASAQVVGPGSPTNNSLMLPDGYARTAATAGPYVAVSDRRSDHGSVS